MPDDVVSGCPLRRLLAFLGAERAERRSSPGPSPVPPDRRGGLAGACGAHRSDIRPEEETVMSRRPELGHLGLGTGKKARLHRILHQHGLGNGTAIFLPYGQGLEHGPLEKARQSMEAGATGLIFGRNVWQREYDESLRFVDSLKQIFAEYPSGA
jgi:hypothetical protein